MGMFFCFLGKLSNAIDKNCKKMSGGSGKNETITVINVFIIYYNPIA